MIKAILAATSMGGIGNRGTLPWPKHSQDLAWFKEHTENQIVVMGRNTWEDPKLTKPLPNRINYIVSSSHVDPKYQHLVRWIPDNPVENILRIQKENPTKDVYVIGGRQLYEATQDIVQEIYFTRMKGSWFTDTKINLDKWFACFRIYGVRPGNNCTYEIWKRQFFI